MQIYLFRVLIVAMDVSKQMVIGDGVELQCDSCS
jgi:hypothetical protein